MSLGVRRSVKLDDAARATAFVVLLVLGTVVLSVAPTASTVPRSRTVSRGSASNDEPPAAEMVLVPSGPFQMGSTLGEINAVRRRYGGSRTLYESEYPRRTIQMEEFYIDRTEVTQEQYRKFVAATGREVPFVDREWAAAFNWVGGTYPNGLGDHPVVLVSYFDAEAYCEWAGKELPTEAEWEKAARGIDGRAYPWGNRWDASRLNSSMSWSDHSLSNITLWTRWWEQVYKGELRGRVVTTKPVGGYPLGASPYGALDMAGNVFEWVADWFDRYPGSTFENPEFGEQYKVVRGGDWYLDPIYNRAAARLRSPADHKVTTIGFRCVRRLGNEQNRQ